MVGGRAAALLARSSSSALHPATIVSHHLSFRPLLLSLSPFRGGGPPLRMASDAAPRKDCSPAAAAASGGPGSSSAAASSPSTSPSSAVDFLTLCHRLKTTKRAGWVRHGVREPESVADHMYRMGVMALISSDLPGVDRERCIKMAIVHDIAEAIVGDITPADGVPKSEKSRREQEALDHMCRLLGGGSRASLFCRGKVAHIVPPQTPQWREPCALAKEIHELWAEYEENSSLEAKIVKDFDKVEMILQALEYEIEQGKDLDEFFQSTAGKFQTDVGKAWASEILSRRKKKEE